MKRQISILACLVLVVAMVCSLASCDLIDKITGKTEHTHSFVEGKCECGESDPNYVPHTHNFVEGKCECGESDPNYVPETPECTEHAWSVETTKEATCTEAGEKTLTCTVCGYSSTQEIAATGHTEETVPGAAPTCTESGLSNGKKCTVCGETTVAQQTIAAKGHSFADGICSVCGEVDPDPNPGDDPEVNEIKVETTDTYGFFDLYSFTAPVEGYYTFNVPAGLAFYSKAQYDAYGMPEIDLYANKNGATVVVGLEAGQVYEFYVGAVERNTWTINWTVEVGDVEQQPGGDTPDDVTTLVVGSNTVVLSAEELTNGKTYAFTVTEEGTYTFASDLMAVIFDANNNQVGRGQVYLVAGEYTVTLFSMMPFPANSFTVNITHEAPASGDPDGSEEFPFVWETLPESVTFESDNMNMVYYVFTATADGSITFTWAVEGNDWFNYFELVDGQTTENNGSGFAKTSHTFVVETGKTYRIGLGTWNEGGETVVSITFSSCDHEWSEATCETLSTCSKCGATTGDYADHTSTVAEPTCSNPDVCGVCGMEIGYVPHSWDDGVVTQQPDCSTETNGIKKLTCTVCGATQEEDIWAFHDWVVDEEIPVTCTEDGYYKAHCSVCNAIEEYTTEAEGHYNWYASCGETTTCMECGTEFTKNHEGSPATCTEPMYCYNCWQHVGEPAGHSYDATGLCTACGETVKLVIAGSDVFFGSDWSLEDENNILSYVDGVFTKTYISTSEGIYQFKVIDVTAAYNWDNAYPSSNYYFYVEVDSKVVVTFDFATKALTVEVYAPNSDVATDGTTYMVVGDKALCGDIDPNGGDWGWETNNYDNLLTLNADGKYELVYTGVAAGTYGIKVVKNGDYGVAEWGDNGANYSIVVAEDGSVVTILFDLASGTISHNVHVHSYFYPCDKVCQECFEESNPNASHTIVAVDAKAATCTENGNIAYWYCSDCGYAWADEALTMVTNQMNVVIPAAHTYTYACDKACAVCYEITNESATHTIVAVEAKAVTCTENGNIAYWYCSDCGYAWADEALTQQTNQMSVVLPALGHADEDGDFKCDACSTVMLPEDGTALTVAQALAIAKLMGDTYTTEKYYITGVIVSIANTTYGNMTIRDANGDDLYLYGLYTWDKAVRYDAMETKPVKGDEITVYTVLGCYYGSPQGKDTWLDELVQHTEHVWAEATCTSPKTCTVCEATEGDKLDHNYANGVCSGCGKVEGAASLSNVTLTFDSSKTNRTSFSSSQQVWEYNGLKFTNDKASSSNAVADYSNPVRLYQGSSVTVEGSGISKVVIVSDGTAKYITALTNSLASLDATVTVSGSTFTIEFDSPVDSFSFSLTAQARLKSITVNP